MIKLLDEIISNKTDCKGQIFRARLNTYVNSKGDYITTKKLLRLKRKSCPGCSECGFLIDDLKEHIACSCTVLNDVEDGKIYGLRIVNISKDWETGIADDWDYKFVEMLPLARET